MAHRPAYPMLSSQPETQRNKIVTAEDAVRLIHDGDTVATGGFIATGFAEEIAIALEHYFLDTGKPRDLTLIYAAGQGDAKEKGLNHLGYEGLVKCAIGGHWGLVPKLQKLAIDNKIQAYNLPQGVISHLFRDTAAHKPGLLTTVGLGTFVDPRLGGGKINAVTTDEIVELMPIHGKEYLFYKTHPVDVAIIRGTTADADGNVTMEKEALTLEARAIAMAAHNSGGIVIVQVERIAERNTLNSRNVKIPGILVDCVVIARPENHWQTFTTPYNPGFSGELRVPMQNIASMEMSARKIIARRAAFELRPNSVVNLGIGMPEGVANIANEEQILDSITLTAEPGVIGGLPASGANFGAATNTQAVIDQPSQFDFYDGGGLDLAFLGLAQADREGNINVSKFGSKLAGAGGFINISQNAKALVFVGTFTAGKLDVALENGQLRIVREGEVCKFLDEVEQRTFSGTYAARAEKSVLYVTERCVLRLTTEGLELTEIAPGVDLERDILAHMVFRPIINDPQLMDARIFRPEPMGLRDELLRLPLDERLSYQPDENLFFVNFEGLEIRTSEEIEDIHARIEARLSPLGKKVFGVVNYDNFSILPELIPAYTATVKDLVDRFYLDVTRYTTSTFLRMKLGDALKERDVAPHIYESEQEARYGLRRKHAVTPLPAEKPIEYQPPQVFRDRLKDGSEGPAMIVIPAGKFWMGSPEDKPERNSNERRHQVHIEQPFAIGQYTVTFEEYDRFCEAMGREKPEDRGWGRGKRPVINVDWHDAVAYAEWLSEQTGKTYRLPMEAEWEYAARAGTTTPFWWGNTITPEQANYDGKYVYAGGGKKGVYRKKTVAVGSFAPNPWGLYDTAGNVWEWTCSKYDEDYGGDEKVCVSNNHTNDPRALRGGSWFNEPAGVRSAGRFWDTPGTRTSFAGFRLARSF